MRHSTLGPRFEKRLGVTRSLLPSVAGESHRIEGGVAVVVDVTQECPRPDWFSAWQNDCVKATLARDDRLIGQVFVAVAQHPVAVRLTACRGRRFAHHGLHSQVPHGVRRKPPGLEKRTAVEQ